MTVNRNDFGRSRERCVFKCHGSGVEEAEGVVVTDSAPRKSEAMKLSSGWLRSGVGFHSRQYSANKPIVNIFTYQLQTTYLHWQKPILIISWWRQAAIWALSSKMLQFALCPELSRTLKCYNNTYLYLGKPSFKTPIEKVYCRIEI